jgi:hypothetical protein
MPAVAQISVDFATHENIIKNNGQLQSSVKAVSPLALSRYCLYNKEAGLSNGYGLNDPTLLDYTGGFITAGDRINYKDSDFQIRKNLDVEQGIYVDKIHSRRKENGTDNYQNQRSSSDRSVTISALDTESSSSFISIQTSPSSRTTTLKTQFNETNNSIVLNSDSSGTNKISIDSSNIDITGTVRSENSASTVWVNSMPTNVKTALSNRDYDNTVLTGNYNSVNVRDLVSEIVGTKPPVYRGSGNFSLENKYDNQTIIINSPTTVTVTLPAGLRHGLQVSFVRAGGGDVILGENGTNVRSSPQNTFRKLAFTNSVATCLLAGAEGQPTGNIYYLFGDLLPVT